MDVTLNTQDIRVDSDHILTDSTASVILVIVREAAANRYWPSAAHSSISLNIDYGNLTTEGNFRFKGEE